AGLLQRKFVDFAFDDDRRLAVSDVVEPVQDFFRPLDLGERFGFDPAELDIHHLAVALVREGDGVRLCADPREPCPRRTDLRPTRGLRDPELGEPRQDRRRDAFRLPGWFDGRWPLRRTVGLVLALPHFYATSPAAVVAVPYNGVAACIDGRA